MYFPAGVAKSLSYESHPQEISILIQCNSSKSQFLLLTSTAVCVWSVRPLVHLCSLTRSETSIALHGTNCSANWSPDSTRIVVQTTSSYLVLIKVKKDPDVLAYSSSSLATAALKRFQPGPGEEAHLHVHHLSLEGVIQVRGELRCVSPRQTHILFSTSIPPAVQRIPWPITNDSDSGSDGEDIGHQKWLGHDTWMTHQEDMPWLLQSNVMVDIIYHDKGSNLEGWITSDGCAYIVYLSEGEAEPSAHRASKEGENRVSNSSLEQVLHDSALAHESLDVTLDWHGICIYGQATDKASPQAPEPTGQPLSPGNKDISNRATTLAFNHVFSTVAVGTQSGAIFLPTIPTSDSPVLPADVIEPPRVLGPTHSSEYATGVGAVQTIQWTSDGYAFAVGWENAWGVFSVSGRCISSSTDSEGVINDTTFEDGFLFGIRSLFWAPGNTELCTLATRAPKLSRLFVIPFAKSTITNQQSPDNTRYAILQQDDAVMIYRGADQPDMSVINPEADVWQHLKMPLTYIRSYWPMRYASISNDGRLLAIAGKRGLIHWSAASGRWKSFADEAQEQAFFVRGGMAWFNHVLIAAVDFSGSYQIRLYSRDLDLSTGNILHREILPSPVILLSLIETSLLVYTLDNTLFHFLITTTMESVKLHLCGSMSFEGVVSNPKLVKGLSWMLPFAQKQLGDPNNDLTVATIILLVSGRLILLRPRKVGAHEVKYDMQILARQIEFFWIHLTGIGALENSLWGYDGSRVRIWLDALTIEAAYVNTELDAYESIKESVSIPLSFYPLSVLMDKGVVIGIEHETATRPSLPFAMFRTITSTHLFLHHVLKYHINRGQLKDAVMLSANYQDLVYFAHVLEVFLHTVLEADSQAQDTEADETLNSAIEFVDHFDSALDVIANCARKTEMSKWKKLFEIAGSPRELFESCLSMGALKTAGSYLFVLHNLEHTQDVNQDTARLLQKALAAEDLNLCRELLHFLRSIDESGAALMGAMQIVGLNIDPPQLEEQQETLLDEAV
ncbi:RIC1-domain-containing protein [Cantharellus anzutake]|uniref:RIC1-domain-containing protein n=1 Tax=Cantharellus anzutake TaxID=1750568 RepID=UPI0019079901|nr:RIC1-domain-containing protein [Cantharellus anzutake]KAF8344080.1 RIC1-domain-containing protein [Cantharellus anzutake]